jgi:hypothetical protein
MTWQQRVAKRARENALRARYKAAGGCLECGTPVEKYAKCQRCRARHAQWYQVRRQRVEVNACGVNTGAGAEVSAKPWRRPPTPSPEAEVHA